MTDGKDPVENTAYKNISGDKDTNRSLLTGVFRHLDATHFIFPVSPQEMFCYMGRKYVLQKHPVQVLHGLNLLTLLLKLVPPEEV